MSDAAALGREDTETRGSEEPGLRVPFNAAEGAAEARASHAAAGARRGAAESQAPRDEPRARRARLTRLLLAKLTLDLVFVAGLAAYTHAVAFRPFYSGSLEHADGRGVRGWVVDRAEPGRPVEVQLYIDGRFFAAGVADRPRPDVPEKGFAPGERHGFAFDFGQDLYGEHEASVYAVHESGGGKRRTLQRIGGPVGFAWKGAGEQ